MGEGERCDARTAGNTPWLVVSGRSNEEVFVSGRMCLEMKSWCMMYSIFFAATSMLMCSDNQVVEY